MQILDNVNITCNFLHVELVPFIDGIMSDNGGIHFHLKADIISTEIQFNTGDLYL